MATHCWTNTFALPRKLISKTVSICSTRIQLDEALRTRRNPPAHLPKDVESMGQPWQRQPSPMCLASASHSSTGDESYLWLKDIIQVIMSIIDENIRRSGKTNLFHLFALSVHCLPNTVKGPSSASVSSDMAQLASSVSAIGSIRRQLP